MSTFASHIKYQANFLIKQVLESPSFKVNSITSKNKTAKTTIKSPVMPYSAKAINSQIIKRNNKPSTEAKPCPTIRILNPKPKTRPFCS